VHTILVLFLVVVIGDFSNTTQKKLPSLPTIPVKMAGRKHYFESNEENELKQRIFGTSNQEVERMVY